MTERPKLDLYAIAWRLPLIVWQGLFFIGPLAFMIAMSFFLVKNYRMEAAFQFSNWGRMLTRGFFWDAWNNDDETTRVQATAEECPRISPAFLAKERRRMPRAAFDSEYLCVFNQQHHALLTEEELDAVFR